MTTVIARRLAAVEAALDAIAPPDDPLTKFKAANPWFEWTRDDELSELEHIYRVAENAGAMTPAAEARAMAIMHTSRARMLGGELKTDDLPPQPYDIQAAYERSKRAMELKGR
jgi:hypothetical protein